MNRSFLDWRLSAGALLAAGALVAAAFEMPVRAPESPESAEFDARLPEAPLPGSPEDLSAFLEIRRWGSPPPEPTKPEPEAAEESVPVLNPVLAEMGFVGLIATEDERAVLLALPEGQIVRMLPGDTLPDGRILVSVADNSLTLKGDGVVAEELTLFPRLIPLPESGADQGVPRR